MTEIAPAVSPDEITADWVTRALEASGDLRGGRVIDVRREPLGTGQMCDSIRLELTYDRATAAPKSLVAKLPAADPKSRATAVMMRCYEKEIRFYQQLAGNLDVATPRAFLAVLDDADTSRFTLLLEDLSPAEQGDQLTGCSVEVAESAISELVGLHAPMWGDPRLTELDWLVSADTSEQSAMQQLLPTLWAGFKDRYASDLDDRVAGVGETLFANLPAYFAPSGGPETIVHGDYRLDNLLVAPDGKVVGVVDWQTCVVGSALSDVAYFIGAGLIEADRRSHEEALVRSYYDALTASGVSGFDWDACWDAYRRATFAGLLMAVGASMMVERTDRGDEMFLAMASRHSSHVKDLEAEELIR